MRLRCLKRMLWCLGKRWSLHGAGCPACLAVKGWGCMAQRDDATALLADGHSYQVLVEPLLHPDQMLPQLGIRGYKLLKHM